MCTLLAKCQAAQKSEVALNVATLYYGTCSIEVIVPSDVPVRNLGEPKWAAKWAK